MDLNKPHSKTKVKSMSKSKTNAKSKSKSNLKSVSKSKTKSNAKTKSKSNLKSVSKSKVKVPIVISREHGELDQVYHMRRAFIESVLKKSSSNDLPMPYVNTLSYVHVYKKLYHYVYPAEIEKKLSDLLA